MLARLAVANPVWASVAQNPGLTMAARNPGLTLRACSNLSNAVPACVPISGPALIKYPNTGLYCNPKPLTGSEHRELSPCRRDYPDASQRECFDLTRVTIVKAKPQHAKLIRSFLYTHHWTREPLSTSLWLPVDHEYLKIVTEKYANTGDRFLAFEQQDRTSECRLVGVLCANKVYPWEAGELDAWGASIPCESVRHRLFFLAHLLRAPRLFEKYHTDYLYKIDVLVTSPDVQGGGLGTQMLWHALAHSSDAKHPVTVFEAYSEYMNKPCRRCRMKKEWSMNYSDYVDNKGLFVFYQRRPHTRVVVYAKPVSAFSEYSTKSPPQCFDA